MTADTGFVRGDDRNALATPTAGWRREADLAATSAHSISLPRASDCERCTPLGDESEG